MLSVIYVVGLFFPYVFSKTLSADRGKAKRFFCSFFLPVASAIANFTEALVLYYCSRSYWINCGAVEAAICFATARSCGERCLADAIGSYGTLAWSMCFRYCGLSVVTATAKFPLHRGALFVMVSLSLSLIISVNLTHVL